MDLLGIPLADLTPWGIVGVFVLLVLTGAIPTRRELRDSQERERQAMDLADKWQKVATEQGMTLNKVLDAVEDITVVVTAIQAGIQAGADK